MTPETENTYLDVLFRVLQVFKQSIVTPYNTGILVGSAIRISIGLSRLSSKESEQVRSLFMRAALFHGVALRAFGFKYLGSFLFTHDGNACLGRCVWRKRGLSVFVSDCCVIVLAIGSRISTYVSVVCPPSISGNPEPWAI
jgi:hypothetical protein